MVLVSTVFLINSSVVNINLLYCSLVHWVWSKMSDHSILVFCFSCCFCFFSWWNKSKKTNESIFLHISHWDVRIKGTYILSRNKSSSPPRGVSWTTLTSFYIEEISTSHSNTWMMRNSHYISISLILKMKMFQVKDQANFLQESLNIYSHFDAWRVNQMG
jgi:hypothetical protein